MTSATMPYLHVEPLPSGLAVLENPSQSVPIFTTRRGAAPAHHTNRTQGGNGRSPRKPKFIRSAPLLPPPSTHGPPVLRWRCRAVPREESERGGGGEWAVLAHPRAPRLCGPLFIIWGLGPSFDVPFDTTRTPQRPPWRSPLPSPEHSAK